MDRIFRHLLVDVTGNTHRAEFCIDKLYSPDSSTGRLGLLELRAFRNAAACADESGAAVAGARARSRGSGRALRGSAHSLGHAAARPFLLPYFVEQDFGDVIDDLRRAGYRVRSRMVRAALRIPLSRLRHASHYDGIELELRQAIEPWYVLGEEPGGGGTARYVDSSVERMQVQA